MVRISRSFLNGQIYKVLKKPSPEQLRESQCRACVSLPFVLPIATTVPLLGQTPITDGSGPARVQHWPSTIHLIPSIHPVCLPNVAVKSAFMSHIRTCAYVQYSQDASYRRLICLRYPSANSVWLCRYQSRDRKSGTNPSTPDPSTQSHLPNLISDSRPRPATPPSVPVGFSPSLPLRSRSAPFSPLPFRSRMRLLDTIHFSSANLMTRRLFFAVVTTDFFDQTIAFCLGASASPCILFMGGSKYGTYMNGCGRDRRTSERQNQSNQPTLPTHASQNNQMVEKTRSNTVPRDRSMMMVNIEIQMCEDTSPARPAETRKTQCTHLVVERRPFHTFHSLNSHWRHQAPNTKLAAYLFYIASALSLSLSRHHPCYATDPSCPRCSPHAPFPTPPL